MCPLTKAESLLDRIEGRADAVAEAMLAACRREIPEYAAIEEEAVLEQVRVHGREHVLAFARAARAGRPPEGDDLEFVRRRARRRARQAMPIESMLHAYRLGQREVWNAIAGAVAETPAAAPEALILSGFTIAYTDAISRELTAAYASALAAEAERAASELFDRALAGPLGAADRARAGELGLDGPGERIVLVMQTDNVEAARHALGVDAFTLARERELVVVAAAGGEELRARIASALQRAGHHAHAGLSAPFASLAGLASAYAEACRALDFAAPGGVVALAEVGVLRYLVERADELAARAVPAAVGELLESDARGGGSLRRTLEAYAAADLSVVRAAGDLHVHPNTVHYRLGRIEHATGLSPRRLDDLVDLLSAARLLSRAER